MAAGCVPAHSLYFSIYEYSRKSMGLNDSTSISFGSNAMIGVFSTAFHDLIMNPCEVIKQRSQLMSHKPYKQIVNEMVKAEGWLSLWRSYPISYAMNVPNHAAIMGCNEVLKQIWRNNNLEHNFVTYFGCASIAGAFAALLTMPLDNIRTRMNT